MKSLMIYQNNVEHLKYVDGVIMPLKDYSVSYINKYTIDEINKFVLEHKDKEIFVVINTVKAIAIKNIPNVFKLFDNFIKVVFPLFACINFFNLIHKNIITMPK